MILGLSHIALGTDDIAGASARLERLGYGLRFDEPALENHPDKADFLDHYQPRHHIRALAAEGAMAIELLDHGALGTEQSAALIPVLRGPAPLADWTPVAAAELPLAPEAWPALERALDARPRAFHDPVLKLTFLWLDSTQAPGLHACVLPHDADAAPADLLAALRFRADPARGLWSLLTPLPALQARLIPLPRRPAPGWAVVPRLDQRGCACLALMARGTGAALPPAALPPALATALRGSSRSFSLTVAHKPCRITMALPGQGPFVELVEPQT
ncbi:hypothetical protein [Phaeovulum vinaykumarii]|uniref:Glyoxalase-like domain-containing protein n=1 Tax=Phaeovulum vinaykumarii TaxID=407234 RepID=A0A1N7JX07_9RHOB|nr:hypothetical protein [Phaeovulum vinaykumarii]SIS53734.1 hypothetical protein SAMN05421795_101403 [Phaeovulum vinaykumarii]SOB91695.1 hypothetical protein SAMN05878426_101401 [Phaeovulum vinaykumarii]